MGARGGDEGSAGAVIEGRIRGRHCMFLSVYPCMFLSVQMSFSVPGGLLAAA